MLASALINLAFVRKTMALPNSGNSPQARMPITYNAIPAKQVKKLKINIINYKDRKKIKILK